MNKYEESLDWLKKTFNQYLGDWQLSSVHFGIHRDFKELVDKETELESRKEKLVVGSVWECVVDCLVETDNLQLFRLTKRGCVSVKILKHNANYVDVEYKSLLLNRVSLLSMPTDQFLLCFKPHD